MFNNVLLLYEKSIKWNKGIKGNNENEINTFSKQKHSIAVHFVYIYKILMHYNV